VNDFFVDADAIVAGKTVDEFGRGSGAKAVDDGGAYLIELARRYARLNRGLHGVNDGTSDFAGTLHSGKVFGGINGHAKLLCSVRVGNHCKG
jgi:hypothetical protein